MYRSSHRSHMRRERARSRSATSNELEGVAEVNLAALAERQLGCDDVPTLDRPLEDRAAVSVLAHQASTWLGPGGEASVAVCPFFGDFR
jgi:hypothetical protein